MKKQYITHEELAAAFGVNRATVTKWKKQGCPSINISPEGKRESLRYSVEEVAAWLREREQSATAGKEVQA